MTTYRLEEDGITFFANKLKKDADDISDEKLLAKIGRKAFDIYAQDRDATATEEEKPVKEDLKTLTEVGLVANSLGNKVAQTRTVRESLAVKLLIDGEDPQAVFEAANIPNPSTLKAWVSKKDSGASKAVITAVGKVKARNAS